MSQIKEQCYLDMNLVKLFTQLVQLCGYLNGAQSVQLTQQTPLHVSIEQRQTSLAEISQLLQIEDSRSQQASRVDTSQAPATTAMVGQFPDTDSQNPSPTSDIEGMTVDAVWDDQIFWVAGQRSTLYRFA